MLAVILPPESADMNLNNFDSPGLPYCSEYRLSTTPYLEMKDWFEKFQKDYIDGNNYKGVIVWEFIPCWSLAALFDTLPKTIGSYSKMMGYFDGAYLCDYIDEDGEGLGNGTTADTLIDAVYEMLLKQNTPK